MRSRQSSSDTECRVSPALVRSVLDHPGLTRLLSDLRESRDGLGDLSACSAVRIDRALAAAQVAILVATVGVTVSIMVGGRGWETLEVLGLVGMVLLGLRLRHLVGLSWTVLRSSMPGGNAALVMALAASAVSRLLGLRQALPPHALTAVLGVSVAITLAKIAALVRGIAGPGHLVALLAAADTAFE